MSNAEEIARWGLNLEDTEAQDALGEVWKECRSANEKWGGRGKGGRGLKMAVNGDSISMANVMLSFTGKELLIDAKLKFFKGHKYGLLGENGVGKSTLLRCMARASIPGFPLNLRISYVQQENVAMRGHTLLEYLSGNDDSESLLERIEQLHAEEERLEKALDAEDVVLDEDEINSIAEELSSISDQIEALTLKVNSHEKETNNVETTTGDKLQDPKQWLDSLSVSSKKVLKGLGLHRPLDRLCVSMSHLSGGWRMRALIAKALISVSNKETDVLLLDEPSNHLDLNTLIWLQSFLREIDDCIVVLVSHDRALLEAVCTDIVEMKDHQLVYFPGSYSDFLINKEELAARQTHMADAQTRKEEHIKKTMNLSYEKNIMGADGVLKAKSSKLQRAAMHSRLDGKRFKLFSLKQLDEECVMFPSRVAAIKADKQIRFKFPEPDMTSLRLFADSSSIGTSTSFSIACPLLTFESCSIHRTSRTSSTDTCTESSEILSKVQFQILSGSKVAIVGPNGKGKSTLLTAIRDIIKGTSVSIPLPALSSVEFKSPTVADEPISVASENESWRPVTLKSVPKKAMVKSKASDFISTAHLSDGIKIEGTYHVHRNVRVEMVQQNHIDALVPHFALTSVELLQYLSSKASTLSDSSVCSEGETISDLNARAHLGKFGISGDVALQPIGSLSGGQKARLSLSCIMLSRPHILLLDEPTNHLSITAIEALIVALREFPGAVIVVSHNQHLLSLVCNELFVVDGGKLTITRVGSSTSGGFDMASSSGRKKKDGSSKSPAAPELSTRVEGGVSSSAFIEVLDSYVKSVISSSSS